MTRFTDPAIAWPGEHPYETLNKALTDCGCAPLHADSTASELNDVVFELMARNRLGHEERLAWDELRDVNTRFLVDWFMYSLAGTAADLAATLQTLNIPYDVPDFRPLADVTADLGAVEVPESFDAPDLLPAPLGTGLPPKAAINFAEAALRRDLAAEQEED